MVPLEASFGIQSHNLTLLITFKSDMNGFKRAEEFMCRHNGKQAA